PGRSELPRSSIRERRTGDARVSSVRGIKPLGTSGRFQTRQVDRYCQRSRHIAHYNRAVRRFGGGAKIALADTGLEVAISSEPSSDHRMALVRNQILPGQGRKKVLPNRELRHSERIENGLPSGGKAPGVAAAIKLSCPPAQHSPIFFTSEY